MGLYGDNGKEMEITIMVYIGFRVYLDPPIVVPCWGWYGFLVTPKKVLHWRVYVGFRARARYILRQVNSIFAAIPGGGIDLSVPG